MGMGLDIHRAALGGWLPGFVRVSNRMAGIRRDPTAAEISAHRGLLAVNALRVENLELFVHHVAPGASLRGTIDAEGGARDAGPPSSAALRDDLTTIILAAQTQSASPGRLHRIYRRLRPFTAGNGRCGRALWMWQVMRGTPEELAAITELDLADAAHPLNAEAVSRSAIM
jgi:hypothetical protein